MAKKSTFKQLTSTQQLLSIVKEMVPLAITSGVVAWILSMVFNLGGLHSNVAATKEGLTALTSNMDSLRTEMNSDMRSIEKDLTSIKIELGIAAAKSSE